MATVAMAPVTSGFEEGVYPITSDVYVKMVEQGLIPRDRRVFLWGGRLYDTPRPCRSPHTSWPISRIAKSWFIRSPKRAANPVSASTASADRPTRRGNPPSTGSGGT